MTNINTFQGDVFIHEYIKHTGDDNNLFGFSGTDTFKIATAGVDAMTVNASQNVGIGTDDPGNSLHVYKAAGEGTSGLFIEKASGNAGTTAALFFGVNSTGENPGVPKAAIFYERNLVNGRGDIKFCNDAVNDANPVTTAAADTRMLIQNNGHVGINNTNAYHTFDVDGDIRMTGHLSQGGSSTSRAYITRKIATAVNNYPSCDFYLNALSGGNSPFYIDAIGYAVNVSGTRAEVIRRRISMHSLTNSSSSLVNGPAWTFSGGISVSFTNSTRRVRVQLTDLRSYSGIKVELKSFSGVTS